MTLHIRPPAPSPGPSNPDRAGRRDRAAGQVSWQGQPYGDPEDGDWEDEDEEDEDEDDDDDEDEEDEEPEWYVAPASVVHSRLDLFPTAYIH